MPDAGALPSVTLRSLLKPGITAIKKYWRPFVLLQGIAAAVVLFYYGNAHFKMVCDQLSLLKDRGGLPITALVAALAGAVVPEFAKAIVMGDRTITARRMRDVGFAMVAFGISGIGTDLFYRGVGRLIGSDTRFGTVVCKMLVDQLGYTPFLSIPYWVLVYLLRAERFNFSKTLGHVSSRWYLERVVPLLLPCWLFWAPMVLFIYSLPGSLQFCLFCCASAAWSLVMVFIASGEASAEAHTPIKANAAASTPAA